MIRRLQADTRYEMTPRRITAGGEQTPVLDEAAPAADSVDQQAYRDGYAKGFAAGESDGKRDMQTRLQALENDARQQFDALQQELSTERGRLAALIDVLTSAQQHHDNMVKELAFEVALESLARTFSRMRVDRPLLLGLCEQLVEEFRAKAIRLCVSASDRAALPDQIEGMDIVVGPGLASGECALMTERGQVESSIASRLKSIYEAMLEALEAEL
ncbi:FliH/SctL family protein [Dyella tabacisoli]|uniref:Uncharacterized protein n=1 Tax=Dyella tabacisoli TaxID=2282381 RepID=A0A369ULP4_9GAMM|nr:FliH/SctL family protein [Dyella tabacisoli]RDD81427.1 hypothetical protein DVJ77_11990 [Dyella tabacisoli]